jgi:hypothetical protein
VTTPARVSTCAYVNPAVAVFLRWLLAGEAVTARMLLAMGIVIAAVVLVSSRQSETAAQTLLHPESAQAGLERRTVRLEVVLQSISKFRFLIPLFTALPGTDPPTRSPYSVDFANPWNTPN